MTAQADPELLALPVAARIGVESPVGCRDCPCRRTRGRLPELHVDDGCAFSLQPAGQEAETDGVEGVDRRKRRGFSRHGVSAHGARDAPAPQGSGWRWAGRQGGRCRSEQERGARRQHPRAPPKSRRARTAMGTTRVGCVHRHVARCYGRKVHVVNRQAANRSGVWRRGAHARAMPPR